MSISIIQFVVIPIITIFTNGFEGENNILVNHGAVKRGLEYLFNSLVLTIPVTIVSVGIALIISITLYRLQFKGRGVLRLMMLLPLINPPFVGSISFIMLFGKRGLITHRLLGLSVSPFGYNGVFVMQVIGLTTIAYLIISAGIKKIDVSNENAARTLAASELRIFSEITLPLLMPFVLNAGVLVFLSSMADFGTPLVIGGPFQTLSSDLYIQITGLYDLKSASISGIFLTLPCVVVFAIQKIFSENKKYWSSSVQDTQIELKNASSGFKFMMISISLLFVVLIVTKFLFVLVGAFTENWGYDYTLTLRHFKDVVDKDMSPFLNSLRLATVVALISSGFGVLLSYLLHIRNDRFKVFTDIAATIPSAVPGILFGIAYLVTFKRSLFGIGQLILHDFSPVILLGTQAIIYFICIYRYIPVGLRAGASIIEHVDPNLEKAAHTLGSSHMKAFKDITFPLLMPAFNTAFIKNFSSTMTTLGAIIFLLLPKNKVAVQKIFQIITSSSIGTGAAMSLMLSAFTGIMMLVFYVLLNFRDVITRCNGENRNK